MFILPITNAITLASTNSALSAATTTLISMFTAGTQLPAITDGIIKTLVAATTTASTEAEVVSPIGIIVGAISSTLVGAFIIQKTTDIQLMPSNLNELNFFSNDSTRGKFSYHIDNIQKKLYKICLERPLLNEKIILQQVNLLIGTPESSESTRIFFGLDNIQFEKFKLDLKEYLQELSQANQPELYEYHLNQFYSFYLNEFSKKGFYSSSSETKNNVYNL